MNNTPVTSQTQKGKTVTINTDLIGRSEAFRIIAIAHATGLPTLLVGSPGTGKTNVLLDYATSVFNANLQSDDMFILEVDEGTRPNEVKGNIDMKELTEHKHFKRNSPITRAKMILINEVDKASSGLRNSFLGIMNEKILFDGENKVPCQHELFVASCNVIPKDEINTSPFWDRFVIKHQIDRISQSGLMAFLRGEQDPTLRIHIPSQSEMQAVQFKESAMEAFIRTCYASMSDRTVLKVKDIAAAIKYIYAISPERALIKATLLMGNKNLADALSKSIEPSELRDIRNRISSISRITNLNDIKMEIDKVVKSSKNAYDNGILEEDIIKELEEDLYQVLNKHEVYVQASESVKSYSDTDAQPVR